MDLINNSITDNESQNSDESAKTAFEETVWRQKVEIFRQKICKLLSARHQKMIENFIDTELGCNDENEIIDDVLVNEIKNGRVSFAYEEMTKFPNVIVDILRFDITHLDLSMNDIRNFEFLKGFKNLKSLIVDGNSRLDTDTLPTINTLELFYANKCEIEYPRSFITRTAVVFPYLKYFSMMDNPNAIRNTCDDAWEGRTHRIRMLAIFINPRLIHFNDKEVNEDERKHSRAYHHYLGPIDYELTKFKLSVDTDDIRKILPVHMHDKALAMLSQDDEEEEEQEERSDEIDEGLADVKISAYFASQEDNDISIASFFDDKNIKLSKKMR